MKLHRAIATRFASAAATLCLLLLAACGQAADTMVPLDLKLPSPGFKGTPKDIALNSYVEPLSDKPRPAMMVPAGLKNLAPAAKLTASDKNVTPEAIAKIIDGDKEPNEDSVVIMRKGPQYIQMDLGSVNEIFALAIWHAHATPKVYHDVIVRIADDPDFTTNVKTIFNNDQDNTSGLGAGTDREYFETNEGKLIDAKGVKARYLRFYSNGSTESRMNEYTEIEVYGRPAK